MVRSYQRRVAAARMRKIQALGEELEGALVHGELDVAGARVRVLTLLEPTEPSWAERQGDLHRALGQAGAAAAAYERAAQLYMLHRQSKKAATVAKKLVLLDPSRLRILAKVDAADATRIALVYAGHAPSLRPARARSLGPSRLNSNKL